jgi:hypothetical protein
VYARSTSFNGPPSEVETGITQVRDVVHPAISALEGYIGLSMMVNRENGSGIVTTAWNTHMAMRESARTASALRDETIDKMSATAEVHEWEIAVMHRIKHAPEGSCVRATWLKFDPSAADRVIDLFKMGVLPRAEEMDEFCSASLMVDRNEGLAVGAVTFGTRAAIEATRDRALAIRTEIAQQSGADILDVQEYELVYAHLHVPEMA